jgi:hypothetical protein
MRSPDGQALGTVGGRAVRGLVRPIRVLAGVLAAVGAGAVLATTAAATTLYAVGDAADGSAVAQALVDAMVARPADGLLYLGDVYESGTAREFAANYEPIYGRLARRTIPVIGNHEMPNVRRGYYPYWAEARGWTPVTARHRAFVTPEGWQVIAYSSEHQEADVAAGRTRERDWVAARMAEHRGTCRLVVAHKGRYVVADDSHDDNTGQGPIWRLIRGRTALNVVAHNHIYGRLLPIDGVTVIVSGLGGHGMRNLGEQSHPVAAAAAHTPMALRLRLRPGAADFEVRSRDGTLHDGGTVPCTPGRPASKSPLVRTPVAPAVPASLRFADVSVASASNWAWDGTGGQSAPAPDGGAEAQVGTDRSTTRISPEADAQVSRENPTRNYGDLTTLRVRGAEPDSASGREFRSYLRFSLTGLNGPPRSATLRLRVTDATPDAVSVLRVANNWTEEDVTWQTAPPVSGAPAARGRAATPNAWLELDVTRAIAGNGRYSFAVAQAGPNSAYYASRESLHPPQLVLRE